MDALVAARILASLYLMGRLADLEPPPWDSDFDEDICIAQQIVAIVEGLA